MDNDESSSQEKRKISLLRRPFSILLSLVITFGFTEKCFKFDFIAKCIDFWSNAITIYGFHNSKGEKSSTNEKPLAKDSTSNAPTTTPPFDPFKPIATEDDAKKWLEKISKEESGSEK